MIYIICAYDENYLIGNKGRIPWFIEGELKRFKELTTNNVVVMGRVTYEEIGRPLPNRTNIVVSNTKVFKGENLFTVTSLKDALELACNRKIYIAGGENLYKETLPLVNKMYITEIHAKFKGDRYFPNFDKNLFDKKLEKRFLGKIPYDYVTYTKKSSY